MGHERALGTPGRTLERGVNVFGSFLSVTEKDITASLEVHVTAGFAFARRVILAFKENGLDAQGCRGTLLFTGATASVRGNVFTSAFAAGKFGIRALSQSLAKEFGKENMHVSCFALTQGCVNSMSIGCTCECLPRVQYVLTCLRRRRPSWQKVIIDGSKYYIPDAQSSL